MPSSSPTLKDMMCISLTFKTLNKLSKKKIKSIDNESDH